MQSIIKEIKLLKVNLEMDYFTAKVKSRIEIGNMCLKEFSKMGRENVGS